eukprot:2071558-Rhodomonas_salina.1
MSGISPNPVFGPIPDVSGGSGKQCTCSAWRFAADCCRSACGCCVDFYRDPDFKFFRLGFILLVINTAIFVTAGMLRQ